MKQLLDLKQEYVIESDFKPNLVKDKEGNYNPEWSDDTKSMAKGKQNVDLIYLYIPVCDANGYYSAHAFTKVGLPKEDILMLAEKIKEIESGMEIGVPDLDLPF